MRLRLVCITLLTVLTTGCICRVITTRDYRVLRVVDGDTFKIEYDGVATSVRLALVDTPERDEAGGPEAAAALRQFMEGEIVIIAFNDADARPGRGAEVQV